MRIGLVFALLSLPINVSGPTWSASEVKNQTAWMVWDGPCINKVEKGLKTRLVAPMVDGLPDKKRMVLEDATVEFEPACGRIAVTKGERP